MINPRPKKEKETTTPLKPTFCQTQHKPTLTLEMTTYCINMSGHALMGCPASRLETMGFVDKLVCCSRCFISKASDSPLWVPFINLCDDTPVFLTETT